MVDVSEWHCGYGEKYVMRESIVETQNLPKIEKIIR